MRQATLISSEEIWRNCAENWNEPKKVQIFLFHEKKGAKFQVFIFHKALMKIITDSST